GRSLCPKCLTRMESQAGQSLFQPERTRYDVVAFHLALWPLVSIVLCLPFLPLITAPIVLYFVVRYWKESRLPDGSRNTRMITAGVIAALELLLGFGVLVLFVVGFVVMLMA
ncbi:MAG: hypothetical protein R6V12_05600, partial [Candidatus Hydrogenedentota bacterium]